MITIANTVYIKEIPTLAISERMKLSYWVVIKIMEFQNLKYNMKYECTWNHAECMK